MGGGIKPTSIGIRTRRRNRNEESKKDRYVGDLEDVQGFVPWRQRSPVLVVAVGGVHLRKARPLTPTP